MAAHHHHCHPSTATTTTSCCCSCYSTCCNPPPPDPLLQSLASHIHHHPLPPHQPHFHSPYLSPPYPQPQPQPQTQTLHHHQPPPYHPPPPTHPQKSQHFQPHHQDHHHQQTQPTVSTLLRRIAALESSLRRQFPPHSTPASSLRDAAARTIQTHFRAFLSRRSQTLRQLKDLSSIKSTLNNLKLSISNNTHLDSQIFSRRAMDLLLKLDSIQGGDPMIRDGKMSISRDLIRFLELIDKISVENVRIRGTQSKSRVLYTSQKMDTADYERELKEKLRSLVEKIHGFSGVYEEEEDEEGIQLGNPRICKNGLLGSSYNINGGLVKRHGGDQEKVKKSVSFSDNGNVSRVFITTHEPNSSEEGSSIGSVDDERELVDNLCGRVEEISGFSKGSEEDEEGGSEDEESPQISGGERNPRRNLRAGDNFGIRRHFQCENGNFVFSAPLPVTMESKADLMKKRKAMKIVN